MKIDFLPLLSSQLLIPLTVIALIIIVILCIFNIKHFFIRILAVLMLLLALFNPTIVIEDREKLKSTVVVLLDKTQSQFIGNRQQQAISAQKLLRDTLKKYNQFDLHFEEFSNDSDTLDPETKAYEALLEATKDIPKSQLAGVILITDGQIHDLPKNLSDYQSQAPFHVLLTGRPQEIDRQIEFISAPRFGLVGKQQIYSFKINQTGNTTLKTAKVAIKLNGKIVSSKKFPINQTNQIIIDIQQGGKNILELSVSKIKNEISSENNTAVAETTGVRQSLKVLLISGEPHSGERTWRNLLKSDASVDLIHFTILRPPEKQDGTPINQLSLIAFPVRELFIDKIDGFDLIVLDRFQQRGVLPPLYFDYIAQYVEKGGALLIAAGPEFAEVGTIANTQLNAILPAFPTGRVLQGGFHPALSKAGKKHPVTRDLENKLEPSSNWGRWFRQIDVGENTGSVVLSGIDQKPLLLLKRKNEGRVALLLSDHGWLWARNFENGGPYVELYRRIAYWLMKEPSLEEEAIRATSRGRTINITRQTMGKMAASVTIISPSGKIKKYPLVKTQEGLYTQKIKTNEIGLYTVRDGEHAAFTHVGAVNSVELKQLTSTGKIVEPFVKKSGGIIHQLANSVENISLPLIVPINTYQPSRTSNKLQLLQSQQYYLKGIQQISLFSGFLGLGFILFVLATMWYREGR